MIAPYNSRGQGQGSDEPGATGAGEGAALQAGGTVEAELDAAQAEHQQGPAGQPTLALRIAAASNERQPEVRQVGQQRPESDRDEQKRISDTKIDISQHRQIHLRYTGIDDDDRKRDKKGQQDRYR